MIILSRFKTLLLKDARDFILEYLRLFRYSNIKSHQKHLTFQKLYHLDIKSDKMHL